MKNNKGLESVFSIVLVLSVILGNFSLPVFAYDKEGVNLEQVKMETRTLSDTNGTILNKLNSISKSSNGLLQDSPIIQKVTVELEKSQQIEVGKKDYVEGEVLVKFKEQKINLEQSAGRAKAIQFATDKNLDKKEDIRKNNISVLKIKDAKTVEQKIAELKNDPNVEYVQPNYLYYPSSIPTNDTFRDQLWALENTGQTINGTPYSGGVVAGILNADIDAPEVWGINEGTNASIIVAVIDTGVAYNHPDLAGNMWNGNACSGQDSNGDTISGSCMHGFDFIDNDKIPLPTTASHGTHVAGTIGAVKNNDKGIIGVAPNVKIMALKVDEPTGGFSTSAIIAAINFAEQNGAKIINASFGGVGGEGEDLAQKNAIASFSGIFVAAAGNDNNNNDGGTHFYPSDYDLDNIISVAATDQNDDLANFGWWGSNYGITSIDVGAPGVNILSAIADTVLLNETFEGVTPPVIPSGWVKGGTNNKWGTYGFDFGNVLYGDLVNPYDNKANTTVTSPTYNLDGASAATFSFDARCDTEYGSALYDYMIIQVSGDGSNFSGLNLGGLWGTINGEFNEWYLDSDADSSGGAFYSFKDKQIPATFLTSNFKFRFWWVTDSSVNNFDGCRIDNIKITKFSDGSDEKYDYYPGTSMAAPHVAGLAALIQGYNPNLTLAQVKNIILTTGDNLASLSGKTVSGKRINAYNALLASNPAKAITAFNFIDTGSGVIDEENYTIEIEVPSGTDVTSLMPTIVVTGALVSPASGVAQDFTESVIYTVTAADSSTQDYIVTVTVASATTHTISGTIKYYDGVKVIPDVAVILEDDIGIEIATTTTDVDGAYSFADVTSGGDYVVRVSKDDNFSSNGVNVLDLIVIKKHTLGTELTGIYEKIAADFNFNLSINVLDLIMLKKFTLERVDGIPDSSWKFYSSDAELTTDNYLTDGLIRSYTNLIADSPNQDFVGIKMGDVNNSWSN